MSWSRSLTSFIKVAAADVGTRQKEITADALQLIVTESPTDETSYKSNHIVTVNKPSHHFDLENKSDTAIEVGNMVIAGAPDFCVLMIQNNAPYGNRLEHGHSVLQAPDGVYDPTFQAIKDKYQ